MKRTQQRAAIALMSLTGIVAASAAYADGLRPAPAQAQAQEWRQDQTRMRFRGMDTDGDGVITRSEWKGNDRSFRQQDKNGDGVLSGAEVRAPLEATGEDRNSDGVITRSEWRGTAQLFREYDVNRDGVISGPEVAAVVEDNRLFTERTAGTSGRLREFAAARFNREDENGDNRIERDEWTGSDSSFDRLDRNNDGILTRAEFNAAFEDRAVGTTGQQQRSTTYQAGYDRGLLEGRTAGKEDKTINGGKWDLEGQRELEQADSGYETRFGPRDEYQSGYRAGFRLGYREGFDSSRN